MQEGKGIFINNTLNKNYPIGEKQTGWTRQGKARQGKERKGTRHKLHTITNQHGTANTRRF